MQKFLYNQSQSAQTTVKLGGRTVNIKPLKFEAIDPSFLMEAQNACNMWDDLCIKDEAFIHSIGGFDKPEKNEVVEKDKPSDTILVNRIQSEDGIVISQYKVPILDISQQKVGELEISYNREQDLVVVQGDDRPILLVDKEGNVVNQTVQPEEGNLENGTLTNDDVTLDDLVAKSDLDPKAELNVNLDKDNKKSNKSK